jgi:NAD-dependent deacetylase
MSPGPAIQQLAGWLREARCSVAFCGAGISTESGIPDFRSPGGLWSRHAPVMFQDFLTDPEARRQFWRQRHDLLPALRAAQPNAGHKALARLEASGRLRAIITQNIDELHQRAGSREVLELHGTAMSVHCLSCDKRWMLEAIEARLNAGEDDLRCDVCGGLLKSRTVSFGQQLPTEVWEQSVDWAQRSDLFLAIGSSLVVYPAAGLVELARSTGAKIVILNRDPTPLDHLADLVMRDPIGPTLDAVVAFALA